MPSTDAATGKAVPAKEHYDLLIGEGDDPVLDPPVLREYMNGWDGEAFMEALGDMAGCRVLEIGVGTGRLALRVMERGCASFTGMDLSERVLAAAHGHLADYGGIVLMQGEFPAEAPAGPFERIYSSLTFMHIEDKRAACRKIAALLAPGGRCVLSLDKDQSGLIDMGARHVVVWPDNPETISAYFSEAGLRVAPIKATERAWLIIAEQIG